MAMLVSVMRSSSVSEAMPSPAKYIVLYVAPETRDVADDRQDQILGRQVRRNLPVEGELHRRRHLEPGLARAQREGRVGVAHAGGKLPERPGGAGVRVGAQQNLAGPHMAFLRQRLVAHALVVGLGRVAVGVGHAGFSVTNSGS